MTESLPDNEDLGFAEPGAPSGPDQPESEPVLTGEDRETFVRAIEIGSNSRTGTVYGHTVTVRTMTMADELAVGQKLKDYAGTLAQAKAYKAAVVAATLTDLDGAAFFTPVRPMSPAERLEAKWNLLMDYYPSFVEAVYGIVKEMEEEVVRLLDKLGKSEG